MNTKVFCSYFLTELLMIFVVIFYYKKISNIKIKLDAKKIIFISLIAILLIINNFYNYIPLRFICSIIITSLIIGFLYKPTIKDNAYYTIIYSIICIIIELLSSIFVPLVVSNIQVLNNTLVLKISLSVVYSLFMLVIFSNQYFIEFIKKSRKIIKIKYIILSIICILNIIIIYRCYYLNNIYVLMLSILCCIFMIITIRVIVNDKYNIKILMNKNRDLKNSFKAYSETIDECREFKHNLKNDLYSLKTLLPIEYQIGINNIIQKYNKKYDWINKIGDIPEGLQGIIFLKQNEALEKKVKMHIIINKDINVKEKDYLDLSNIIGILLDNAIEASSKTKEKIISLNITETNKNTKIQIINTFNNGINITKIGQKNYSTKEFKSGIGLNYIKKIKNNNIKVKFKIVDNLFITDIIYQR